jgi:hypothetical protein
MPWLCSTRADRGWSRAQDLGHSGILKRKVTQLYDLALSESTSAKRIIAPSASPGGGR